jgi:HTH-type transcriptional regulator, global nitrogen regulator NrpRI
MFILNDQMELLDEDSHKKVVNILKILQNQKKSMGSITLGRMITAEGDFIPSRTVRYYLQLCDVHGFTAKTGKKGERIITASGIEEIKNSFVMEKIGLVSTKIAALTYEMSFSLKKAEGTIILNLSVMRKKDFMENRADIRKVFEKKISMGQLIRIFDKPDDYSELRINLPEPEKKIIIGTICSMTLNGIFMSHKVNIRSRFGGILEMKEGEPVRFTDLINYDGTSLDPAEVFLQSRMTSVGTLLKTGSGKISASFREFPAVAYYEFLKLKTRMDEIGLNCILAVGKPGKPLCHIPVSEGMTGFIVSGGMNPFAPLMERGIPVENHALYSLYDIKSLKPVNEEL